MSASEREKIQTTETREDGFIRCGESDHFILPMKAGNAARGKEMTHVQAI